MVSMGGSMDEEKQAWRFTPEILKDLRKTESTVIALAAKIEQISTGLKNLATLNRLGVNFNNITAVKTLANEIRLMTPPASEQGLKLVKNIGALPSKVYVLSMVKNQFTAIINDATAACPSLQYISASDCAYKLTTLPTQSTLDALQCFTTSFHCPTH
jgi:Leucine-rich repeat (LRR) protein